VQISPSKVCHNLTIVISTDGEAAEAIFVFGMSGPEGGSAEVMLDGVMTQILNLTVHHETMEWALRLTGNSQATWKTYSSLLYQGAGFNVSDTHSLSIVHTTPGRQLVIDYALLTVPVTTSSYV